MLDPEYSPLKLPEMNNIAGRQWITVIYAERPRHVGKAANPVGGAGRILGWAGEGSDLLKGKTYTGN
jgi:hypothetical protein